MVFFERLSRRGFYIRSPQILDPCWSHTIISLLLFNFLINTEKSSIFFIDYPLNPELYN